MPLEQEIRKITGVSIKSIPSDGKQRSFPVGNKKWFAMNFGECGSFGCWQTNELYGWSGAKCWPITVEKPKVSIRSKQLEEEKKIVAICNAQVDSGHQLSAVDLDRYILALTNVLEHRRQQEARQA